MIAINLLPKNLRQKSTLPQIPALKVVSAVAALFGILTLFFYIDYIRASIELKRARGEWTIKEPEIIYLNQLQAEVQGSLKQEVDFFNNFATAAQPLTALLVWASESLPDNSWLTELKLERDEKGNHFFLKGLSLPSKGKSGIEQIETYLHKLKGKMPGAELNLTTSRQTKEGVELTQFIANFNFGSPMPVEATS